ncbi:MAG TPA: AAA family ATPase, partial [Planctomycetaceae bacterium]|nr:AAA family ATPase [Planctomycetaceae bacterium]
LPWVKEFVSWGAGPRAGQYLILGAKARALLEGRFHATTEDVRAIASAVLRHRLVTTFAAQSQGITPDVVVERLLDHLRDRDSA